MNERFGASRALVFPGDSSRVMVEVHSRLNDVNVLLDMLRNMV